MVSGARNLYDGIEFAVVSRQADLHHAIGQQLRLNHAAPSHVRTGDVASTKRSIRRLFA